MFYIFIKKRNRTLSNLKNIHIFCFHILILYISIYSQFKLCMNTFIFTHKIFLFCQHKNEYRRSIDDYQTAAPVQRRIGLYWILATLRIVLTFVSQTGYIHPDEFFQSIEVISGNTIILLFQLFQHFILYLILITCFLL